MSIEARIRRLDGYRRMAESGSAPYSSLAAAWQDCIMLPGRESARVTAVLYRAMVKAGSRVKA